MSENWEPTKNVEVPVALEFTSDLGPGDERIVAHDIAQKLLIGDPWFGLSNVLQEMVTTVNGEKVARKACLE